MIIRGEVNAGVWDRVFSVTQYCEPGGCDLICAIVCCHVGEIVCLGSKLVDVGDRFSTRMGFNWVLAIESMM